MQLRDFSFESPQENILYDETLLRLAQKHNAGEFLRFWESPKVFIVLGRIGQEQEDIWLDKARQDKIMVLRRTSGGGTVIQGPGCLNYTFVLNKNRHVDLQDVRKSYVWISAKIIEALKVCSVEAVFRPISDIVLAESEKKISGNAQHRSKDFILHHGTILYNFNLEYIYSYLRMPKEVPEYRHNRDHKDFVVNAPVLPVLFKKALSGIFGLRISEKPQQPLAKEVSALEKLLSTHSAEVNF